MMQRFLVCIIALWNVLSFGAIASPAWNRRLAEIDKSPVDDEGLRLLKLQEEALRNVNEAIGRGHHSHHDEKDMYEAGGDHERKKWSTCTKEKLRIRKEWRFLSKKDRENYINAVYCLKLKPSLYTEQEAPGSKSLFDSFTAVHINQTLLVHGNFNFLAWHRYFVWLYEEALRDCGYKGPIPYWEWGYDVYDPHKSPLFDGSPHSLGSDGAPLPNREPTYLQGPPPPIPQPPPGKGMRFSVGLGGGCVMSGPFAEMPANLGPVILGGGEVESNPLRHKPSCLKRDLSPEIGQKYNSFNWSTWSIEESVDIVGFQSRLSGDQGQGHGDYPLNFWGVHGGGHTFLGGETGHHSDFYASPQDPAFFLHHAQIDRLWSIWQWLDIKERRDQFYGTLTFANIPPSRNGTLDDLLEFGRLAPPIPLREVMGTTGGPFCYFYE
ncbi:hypothetical protein FQN52_001725 [Onygenales sp. PD_12]|nr:hypothetical protein FQN52_001725 [Onygenales sp. PD_12]